MDSQSYQKNQFILFQGAILGLLQVLLLIILYKTDRLMDSGLSSLSWVIYIVFIYWSAVQFRNKFNNGFITYGKSFVYGVKISGLSGIIIGFFFLVLIKVIEPDFANKMIVEAEEAYLQMGFSEKQVEEMGSSIAMVSNVWVLMISNILNGLLFGTIFSLIISFFVKKSGNPFDEAMNTIQ